MNPFFPVNALVMMRGAVAAQRLGAFERFVDEVYRHMWRSRRSWIIQACCGPR